VLVEKSLANQFALHVMTPAKFVQGNKLAMQAKQCCSMQRAPLYFG